MCPPIIKTIVEICINYFMTSDKSVACWQIGCLIEGSISVFSNLLTLAIVQSLSGIILLLL